MPNDYKIKTYDRYTDVQAGEVDLKKLDREIREAACVLNFRALGLEDAQIIVYGDSVSDGPRLDGIVSAHTVGPDHSRLQGKFAANVTQVLFEDDTLRVRWDGVNKQPQVSPKIAGWWDISARKISGNSTRDLKRADDIHMAVGSYYYLSTGGTRTSAMDMENYGATGVYSVTQEQVNTSNTYTFSVGIGNTSNGWYKIEAIKP